MIAIAILAMLFGRIKIKTTDVRPNLFLAATYTALLLIFFIVGLFKLVDVLALQSPDQAIIANTPGWNIGLAIRQLGPSFAALAVVMMFVGLLFHEFQTANITKRFIGPITAIAVPILSLGLVIWSVTVVVGDRRHQTDGWQNQILPGMEILASDPSINGRVAFGMSSNGIPGIFELWGDYRYGEQRGIATGNYEKLALFNIKQAVDRIGHPEKRLATEYTGVKLVIQNIYRSMPKYLPPFRDIITLNLKIAADDLVRGDLINDSVERVAYLTQEREELHATKDDLEAVLIRHFGPGTFYEITHFGRKWEVFDIER